MTEPTRIILGATALLIALRLAAELTLAALNRRAVRAGPAAAYTLEKSRLGDLEAVVDASVLALAVFGGILPAIHDWAASLGPPGAAWTGALFLVASGFLLAVPSLPFDWWSRFRVEARFGFNRSTPKLWVTDKLKGAVLAAGLGFLLLWALLALADRAGPAWWLWGAALVYAVQFLLSLLYPRLILPLFNRLRPLPEGELRSRLVALGERTGFRAGRIETIDGSRRSAHSNAFFTGFGRFRRVVLFDTLVAQMEPAELEAVLAHEIGHYRRGHVLKMLALSALALPAGFALLAWLARSPWFNPAFGFPPEELAPTLLLFGLLGNRVTFWLSPLMNLLSRRWEYQADAFAREAMAGPGPMIEALRKLHRQNLSNPTPHPWFSAFYYSHPTPEERERALRSL